jgi:hypothetical protein
MNICINQMDSLLKVGVQYTIIHKVTKQENGFFWFHLHNNGRRVCLITYLLFARL